MAQPSVLSELPEPIVQAPLAGGPSTPALTIAVCGAGGLGFLAAGYRKAADVRSEIDAVRRAIARPFGVNLFVPPPPRSSPDPERLREYLARLAPEAERQGVALGEPRNDDDQWDEKLELVHDQRVPVVSFTFGCPPAEVIARLRDAGIEVWVTVTRPDEAAEAERAGADALIVQGAEAGGHRGSFSDDDQADPIGLLPLLRLVARTVSVPLVAAGGIADGEAVAAVICAGATAAQIGTALMLTPEAATIDVHRALLATPISTGLTRAFTGRLARGLVNRFLRDHTAAAVSGYPAIHHATSPLRAAARKRGDSDAVNLWAGQAHQLAQPRPAADIVSMLGRDARAALAHAAKQFPPRQPV